jgi:phage baseplate assembly protein W
MAGRELQYSDISSSFTAHPITGELTKVKGENAIKQSIQTIINTKHYERVFRPEIGCNVEQYLFDPMNDITTSNIQRSIENSISALEPRIELVNVSILPDEDHNLYTITITYFIISLNEQYTFTTYLNRTS